MRIAFIVLLLAGRGLIAAYQVNGHFAFTVCPPFCPGDTPDALPCVRTP